MADASNNHPVFLGGDHDHGIGMLVRFYAARLGQRSRILYCDGTSWPAEGVDWIVLHEAKCQSEGPRPLAERYEVAGQEYRRFAVFESTILSGWRWHCYRKLPRGEKQMHIAD
jgi:hypothetical protein